MLKINNKYFDVYKKRRTFDDLFRMLNGGKSFEELTIDDVLCGDNIPEFYIENDNDNESEDNG